MYPRTARRGQLCGGEELRDHGRDALRRARPPGNRLLLPAHPAVATTGAGDGGAHYPRSARRGQLCGGEGVPGIGKAQALPRTARSRPSCPLQLVTIKRVQKTTLHNRSSWVASTSLSEDIVTCLPRKYRCADGCDTWHPGRYEFWEWCKSEHTIGFVASQLLRTAPKISS
jgi:hypothetical protein